MGFTGVVTVIIFAVLVFALFFIVKEIEQKNWRRGKLPIYKGERNSIPIRIER